MSGENNMTLDPLAAGGEETAFDVQNIELRMPENLTVMALEILETPEPIAAADDD